MYLTGNEIIITIINNKNNHLVVLHKRLLKWFFIDHTGSDWNLKMLVFEKLEETGEPKEKSLGGKLNARTDSLIIILNPHMASPVGFCW